MNENHAIERARIHDLLDAGAIVVTGNIRLSRALLDEYDQRALRQGKTVWGTPEVLPWDSWLRLTWEQFVLDGMAPDDLVLLSPEQEQQLWVSVIDQSDAVLMRTDATASLAGEAWRLLQQWQCVLRPADFRSNVDTRNFHAWCSQFEKHCKSNNWLPESMLAGQLAELVERAGWPSQRQIMVMGYDELTPIQHRLLEAVQHGGGNIRWVSPHQEAATVHRLECTDQRDEIDCFSRWARFRLEQNPNARIGLVAPDLGPLRAEVCRILDRVLSPSAQQPGANTEQRPWNISLGLPLARNDVIGSALGILSLGQSECEMALIATLLRCPYLDGAASEAGPRALLDSRLRQLGDPAIDLTSLVYWAGREGQKWYSPILAARLKDLLDMVQSLPRTAGPAVWAEHFAGMLRSAGWAEDRGLSSEEHQAIEAWYKLLGRFSAIDLVTDRMSYAQALAIVRQLSSATLFQPRSRPAPVQVLGLYEVMGQRFDHLWVMGLHDDAWPPSPHPNPFIPLEIQRRLGMPHADQRRSLQTAMQITQRLKGTAPDIIMSCPARLGEETLRPSPLITDLHAISSSQLGIWNGETWVERIRSASSMEILNDDSAPACEEGVVSGGSGIFRAQSLCPFRAFAEYRLGARELQTPEIGLDAMQRGKLLHRIMELFWHDVGSHARLLDMDEAMLNETVGGIIDTVVSALPSRMLGQRFRAIEAERLKELVLEWLLLEQQRAPFTVLTLENRQQVDVAGIDVRLTIDRVDQLSDGGKLIIDYKTGKVTPSQWFGDRPDEPQLPLYSVIEEGEICAVLFAQIKADSISFNGVVEREGLVPGLPPARKGPLREVTEQWPEVLEEWHATIERLATEFKAGCANVDPKEPATCDKSYCPLHALCRIDERDDLISII